MFEKLKIMKALIDIIFKRNKEIDELNKKVKRLESDLASEKVVYRVLYEETKAKAREDNEKIEDLTQVNKNLTHTNALITKMYNDLRRTYNA